MFFFYIQIDHKFTIEECHFRCSPRIPLQCGSAASRGRAKTWRKELGYTRASRCARASVASSLPLAAARWNQYLASSSSSRTRCWAWGAVLFAAASLPSRRALDHLLRCSRYSLTSPRCVKMPSLYFFPILRVCQMSGLLTTKFHLQVDAKFIYFILYRGNFVS